MAIFYEKPEVKFVHRDKPANLIRVGRMIMLGARSSPQGSVGERN
jgi:hypothetical protein